MEFTVYILLGFIVFQNIIHYFEKRDLYRLIKSKNLQEYDGDDTPPPRRKPAHARILEEWRKPKGGGSE